MTRPFSKISELEMEGMSNACQGAAIRYAVKIGMGGLSSHGAYNIYTAIQDAIRDEWEKSRGTTRT